jgi:hypothetical protein
MSERGLKRWFLLASACPLAWMLGCGNEEEVSARVVINEILPDNEKAILDDSHPYYADGVAGAPIDLLLPENPTYRNYHDLEDRLEDNGVDVNLEYDDCIELYNTGTRTVDISDYSIKTEISEPATFKDAAGLGPDERLTLDGGELLLLWADNGGVGEGVHLPFKLDADGPNSLTLRDGEDRELDYVRFLTPGTPRSYSRVPDGGEDWKWCAPPTPGRLNGDECADDFERTDAGSGTGGTTSSGTGGSSSGGTSAGTGGGAGSSAAGTGGGTGSSTAGAAGSSAGAAGAAAGAAGTNAGGAGGTAGLAGSAGAG